MKISVVTENEYLYDKIRILFSREHIVERSAPSDFRSGEVCIWDVEAGEAPTGDKIITVGRVGAKIPYPVPIDALRRELKRASEGSALLTLGEGCVYLRGERIELTEVEYALIRALYGSGGRFVRREDLLFSVWGSAAGEGVLNVYVHYLRQKLEFGEKIIISSRGEGYKIDEKYL